MRIGQKKRLISYKIKDPQYSRKYHLKHRYGITEEQFQFMLKLQGDKCPICLESSPRGKGFVVDHDHTTGEIRGIICDLCNKGLGALRDSELIVNNALSYLRKQVNDK